MDYRATLAEIRSTRDRTYLARTAEIRLARDREIERARRRAHHALDAARAARAEAREAIEQVTAARDAEIHRLAPLMSARAIAAKVGCTPGTVLRVLRPELRERWDRGHWPRKLRAVA